VIKKPKKCSDMCEGKIIFERGGIYNPGGGRIYNPVVIEILLTTCTGT